MKNRNRIIIKITFLFITLLPLFLFISARNEKKVSIAHNGSLLAQAADTSLCTSGITYKWNKVAVNTFTSFSKLPKFKVSSSSNEDKEFTNYAFHQASGCGKNYAGYCLHMGLAAPIGIENQTMEAINGFDTIVSTSGNAVDISLLEDVIANGFQYDSTNTLDISNISSEQAREMLATQILVWEVVEGGRVRSDGYEPSYHADDSAYNRVILQDEGLNTAYKKVIDNIKKVNTKPTGSVFSGGPYTLSYDGSKYTTSALGSLNGYNNCQVTSKNDESASVNVSTNINNNTVTVTSNKPVEATITCEYQVGSSVNKFRYFRFNQTAGLYCATRNCQDIVQGVGGKTYKSSFNVKTESGKIKIKKIGINNENLDGAVFKLTHSNLSSYSKDITGNSNAVQLDKSGTYYLRETSAPFGYETIPETSITFNFKTNKVDNCQGQKNINNKMTCANGLIGVNYENDGTILLVIVDTPKNFKIQKLNEKNQGLKGAKLQVRDSKGNVVKFNKQTDFYTYSESGSVTEFNDPESFSYNIALLPQGEYTVVELSAPYPYILPSNESDRSYKFKISDKSELLLYDTVNNNYSLSPTESIDIHNYTTYIDLKKTGDGKPLQGVKFLLYDSTKNKQIRCTMVSSGVYNFNENQNSGEDITYITNSDGKITVNYLPVGKYYFREIESVDDYVVPEGDLAFFEFNIDMQKNGQRIDNAKYLNGLNISNTKASFNFYKVDEDGNYLTTAKFKIQKYNEEKSKYEDIKLVSVKNDGSYNEKADLFKIDNENGKIQFRLTNGIATFIDMPIDSLYRIVELEAPEGYIKSDLKDSATIKIDKSGNASGLTTMINQKVSKEDSSAQAELVIEIQTGQTRIRYAIIIVSILIAIFALLTIIKMKKK